MNKEQTKQLFEEIVGQHKSMLYKIARIYCPFEEDRQDLVQEMLIRIWLSLPKYKPGFKVSTWIYRVSLNTAISYYRKHSGRKNKMVVLDPLVHQIEEIAPKDESSEQINLLFTFINQLKELDKAIIFLYLEEKSHEEIAEITGLSQTNVGTKILRIKKLLATNFLETKN
jgi:RNA polymerase sigma factor (sigma-70 family)